MISILVWMWSIVLNPLRNQLILWIDLRLKPIEILLLNLWWKFYKSLRGSCLTVCSFNVLLLTFHLNHHKRIIAIFWYIWFTIIIMCTFEKQHCYHPNEFFYRFFDKVNCDSTFSRSFTFSYIWFVLILARSLLR